jgi:hypothetical protein
MTVRKQWIQSATVGVDEETGALVVAEGGELVEKKAALPNATHVEVDMGRVCRNVIIFVPASIAEGTLQVSLLGIATANSPEIDGSIMPRIPVPQGTSQVSFYSASNLSAKKATIWGW